MILSLLSDYKKAKENSKVEHLDVEHPHIVYTCSEVDEERWNNFPGCYYGAYSHVDDPRYIECVLNKLYSDAARIVIYHDLKEIGYEYYVHDRSIINKLQAHYKDYHTEFLEAKAIWMQISPKDRKKNIFKENKLALSYMFIVLSFLVTYITLLLKRG